MLWKPWRSPGSNIRHRIARPIGSPLPYQLSQIPLDGDLAELVRRSSFDHCHRFEPGLLQGVFFHDIWFLVSCLENFFPSALLYPGQPFPFLIKMCKRSKKSSAAHHWKRETKEKIHLRTQFHLHGNQCCRSTHMTPECWYMWRLSDKCEFLHCTRQCLKTSTHVTHACACNTHVHIQTHTHICTHTYTHIHIQTHTHIRTHKCEHTHTRTQTQLTLTTCTAIYAHWNNSISSTS